MRDSGTVSITVYTCSHKGLPAPTPSRTLSPELLLVLCRRFWLPIKPQVFTFHFENHLSWWWGTVCQREPLGSQALGDLGQKRQTGRWACILEQGGPSREGLL